MKNLFEAIDNYTKYSEKIQHKVRKAEEEIWDLKQVELNLIENLIKSIVENGQGIRDEIWRQYSEEIYKIIAKYSSIKL